MKKIFYNRINNEINTLKEKNTYKNFKYNTNTLNGTINVEGMGDKIVLCSNNYLGLAGKKEIVTPAVEALNKYGAGASSVRFICGTYDIHRDLEKKTADFLGMEASISYTSCWAANTAAIPALLADGDAVISDELNHASIIDGCRMVSKGVKKAVYKHSNMQELENRLIETKDCDTVLIVTDGVFSMEGDICKLPEIIELANKYGAILMVDDSHSTGVMGKTGRGTCEYFGIKRGVDIISGTYGKALGGAGGGFISSSSEVCDILAQRSRPHLFSNSLPPVLCAIAMASIDYLDKNPEIVVSLKAKADYCRKKVVELGLKTYKGDSAIIPIIIGDTAEAIAVSDKMMDDGIFTIGFGFPVVPEGTARVRLQISDSLSYEELDLALASLERVTKVK